MPPIYRHVVPDVPAWTADNGKPCFRGNAPSCRAGMRLSITIGGSISFTGPLWKGPPSINVSQNSWTGAGEWMTYGSNNFFYNVASLELVGGYMDARHTIGGGTATHDDTPSGGWRAMGIFFGGTYYNANSIPVGQFSASLRGGTFYLDHSWDARLRASVWNVYLKFDHNWNINPARYDETIFPDGARGIAPVQLWQFDEQGSILAGAVIVPSDNPVLRFDCADIWPPDDFRLGTTHRFDYAGVAGEGIDISNVYIDVTAQYA